MEGAIISMLLLERVNCMIAFALSARLDGRLAGGAGKGCGRVWYDTSAVFGDAGEAVHHKSGFSDAAYRISTRRLCRTEFLLSAIAISIALGAPSSAYKLIGRVEHSEVLPPVTSDQEIGKIFEQTQLFKAMALKKKGADRRFRVPPWLAGEWSRTEATELTRAQLSPLYKRLPPAGRTVAKVRDRFGTYKDASGQVWQVFSPAHAYGSVDRGTAIDYHSVADYQLIDLGNKRAVVEVIAFHAVVSKKTNKVISAYQDEELNTYTSLVADAVKTESSVKQFNTAGRPMFLTTAVSIENKVAPFTPVVSPKAHIDKPAEK